MKCLFHHVDDCQVCSHGLSDIEKARYDRKKHAKDTTPIETLEAVLIDLKAGKLKARKCIVALVNEVGDDKHHEVDLFKAGFGNDAEYFATVSQIHQIAIQRLMGG